MTAVLTTLVLGLLGLLAAIVLLPFDLRAAGAIHEGAVDGQVRARWAFGLAVVWLDRRGLRLGVLGVPLLRPALRRRGAKPPEHRPERRGDGRAKQGGWARLRAGLRERGPLLGAARRLLAALHPRLRLSGRAGAGDPVDTAAVQAALAALAQVPGVTVDVELDWLDEVAELTARGTARVWVIEVLAVLAGVLLVRAHRTALRAVVSGA